MIVPNQALPLRFIPDGAVLGCHVRHPGDMISSHPSQGLERAQATVVCTQSSDLGFSLNSLVMDQDWNYNNGTLRAPEEATENFPKGSNPPPFKLSRQLPVIDAATSMSPETAEITVPQGRYSHRTKSSRTRYGSPKTAQFVAFVNANTGKEGINFQDILGGMLAPLLNPNDIVLEDCGINITFHVLWAGCMPWKATLNTKRKAAKPITRADLAKRIGHALRKFMKASFIRTVLPSQSSTSILHSLALPHPTALKPEQIVLRRFTQVTHGGWQADLAALVPGDATDVQHGYNTLLG
ncbi:uncharacterized protein STEHIDRAFT_153108 [Stereum hirsutum FP-91666 SS1]|uniref:uncharacterized protein n=1 Tax=Stereum hirsutum (strain FP-91666) TaxID=721885 RepID=UPI000440FCB2|nr:uncharacterized protein STEHIDRAFT_153108 [Stereum hirsutum FP-91666 SS1]EIM91468.1 hypothetical protein STEHIDRAFT_153108 [Stereum hirsutum FP-91666 SS1]